jgi:hypothetical protein
MLVLKGMIMLGKSSCNFHSNNWFRQELSTDDKSMGAGLHMHKDFTIDYL